MISLTKSGLPISYNSSGDLSWDASMQVSGTGRKTVFDMAGLLMNPGYLPGDEPYYDVYRAIIHPEDEPVFKEYRKRYDITVVMPSPENGECKKTAGHFHSYLPGRHCSYPEVYEVLAGTALYILVKVNDHLADDEHLVIEDVRLATVHAGETIIIPPLYGHASINIGQGPLIFNNVCTLENKSDYSLVKRHHGMPYYIIKEYGELKFVKNPSYKMDIPAPRMMKVLENPEYGIIFNNPIYHEFLKRPQVFSFLENPIGKVEHIMNMLADV